MLTNANNCADGVYFYVFGHSKQLLQSKFFFNREKVATEGEKRGKKADENNGHYVFASSRLPERRPLERRTLAPTWDLL